VVGLDAIFSSIISDLALQEVLPPIQDEHGHVMEYSEWAHKESRWCCKVDPCTNSYVTKWLLY
jgi:hypothetical protein